MKHLLLLAILATTEPISVSFYSDGCKLEGVYAAEQVHISNDNKTITLFFEDGSDFTVPFKYLIEVQIRFHAFFKSYSLVDDNVVENKTPVCDNSI